MNKKAILITGAASGIGRETALLFAKKDWYVGIFDIDEQGLTRLESEIGKENCFSSVMNVTDENSVQTGIAAFAEKTEGKLNVLLNNAGILKLGLYENVQLKDQHQIVDVNFKGCLNCIYYCLPYLKKTTSARIINMSSMSSLYGLPELAVYSSTKHALSAMTEALDIELEAYDIKVCDIKPPYVKTPMIKDAENTKSLKSMRILSALGGHINSEKVAKTVWKAANKNKLHWNIGFTGLMGLQCWLLPFTVRFAVKLLAMPRVRN